MLLFFFCIGELPADLCLLLILELSEFTSLNYSLQPIAIFFKLTLEIAENISNLYLLCAVFHWTQVLAAVMLAKTCICAKHDSKGILYIYTK